MEKMKKLCEVVEQELHKIAEKGLTTSNLDTAYKLGYSHAMDDEYSMRGRKRDRMGRYSRDDGMMYDDMMRGRGYSHNDGMMHDRYMNAKMSYRADKSHDSKQRLMDSLEDYMDEFTNKIKEMSRDADTAEEKELIKSSNNFNMVPIKRLELLTYALRMRCSTN